MNVERRQEKSVYIYQQMQHVAWTAANAFARWVSCNAYMYSVESAALET